MPRSFYWLPRVRRAPYRMGWYVRWGRKKWLL